MPSTPLTELIPVLQVAVSPVILISGVGLLLLSLTNRFGSAVDRTRQIHNEVIYRRARLIQFSIVMSALSALSAAMLILTLFFTALWKLELGALISLFFVCCLGSLIVSLVIFIMDIRLSLNALKVELARRPR